MTILTMSNRVAVLSRDLAVHSFSGVELEGYMMSSFFKFYRHSCAMATPRKEVILKFLQFYRQARAALMAFFN